MWQALALCWSFRPVWPVPRHVLDHNSSSSRKGICLETGEWCQQELSSDRMNTSVSLVGVRRPPWDDSTFLRDLEECVSGVENWGTKFCAGTTSQILAALKHLALSARHWGSTTLTPHSPPSQPMFTATQTSWHTSSWWAPVLLCLQPRLSRWIFPPYQYSRASPEPETITTAMLVYYSLWACPVEPRVPSSPASDQTCLLQTQALDPADWLMTQGASLPPGHEEHLPTLNAGLADTGRTFPDDTTWL